MIPSRFLFIAAIAFLSSPLAAQTPLTLDDCYRKALALSETVRIREEEIRAAEARFIRVRGGLLPHLTLEGTEQVQDASGVSSGSDTFGSTFVRRSRPEVAVNLTQPIFQGFREFNALAASRVDRGQADAEKRRAAELLYEDVAGVFLTIKRIEKDRQILESQKEVMRKRLVELEGRIRLGKSRKSEVLTTASQLKLLEAESARVEGDLLETRATQAFLTGIELESPLADPDPALLSDPPPVNELLPQAAGRADVEGSRYRLDLARSQLRYEKGGLFPTIDLDANYYPYRVGFLSEIDWDLLLTLKLPLFQGGERRGLIREARARLKIAELERSEAGRRSELEIRQTHADLVASREEARSLLEAAGKAEQTYAVLSREYRLGLTNNLEVLQALRDWQEMERRANEASFRSIENAVRLKVAIGKVANG